MSVGYKVIKALHKIYLFRIVQVDRYIAQIKNMKIAMSGLDFFYVTRTMILTVSKPLLFKI